MDDRARNLALKSRVNRGDALLLPGVANALAARVAQDCGYEALYVSGAGVANANLGVPDIGLAGLSDVMDVVFAVRQVCDLPLIVDADTGFGNAINVRHTVRRLEAAGASAIQLEDQDFPKRCGHFDGKAVVAAGEMVAKVQAACEARRDPDLQIIARTDAAATEGFEAAIARAKLYADAGADILFVEALTTVEQIKSAPKLIGKPLIMNVVIGGKSPVLPIAELSACGYGVVLYANVALQASILAMQSVLSDLKAHGALTDSSGVATFAERQRIVGKPEFDRLEERYRRTAEAVEGAGP
jgi:2-methylisocitrate lyase-like PEP mutase family enzyme